jgi:hypothetical protein
MRAAAAPSRPQAVSLNEGALMNRLSAVLGAVAASLAALLVVACGGGGSTTTTTAGATASSVSGVISGFGSVIVGGREFATTAATHVVDGDSDDAPATTGDLQVGMMVDVDADSTGMAAARLRFHSIVRGEVDVVDAPNNKLTVLGQTVNVTSATSFSGAHTAGASTTPIAQLTDVQAGDYVVVHGFIECPASGCTSGATQINATLVHEPPAAGMYLAQGFVSGLAADGSHFALNGLTVTIAKSGTPATLCNTAGCAFANGDFVVVRATAAPTGTSASTAGSLTVTAASIVKRREAPTFTAGTTVTIEGAVMGLAGTSFSVRGVVVNASAPTLSSVLGTLANGQIVDVTGTIDAAGTLVASAITVERAATMMLMAPLDAPPTATTLSVLGQTFTVTMTTRFADWAQGARPFNASNFATVLKAGDQLIVSGFATAGGNVATRVERIPTPANPIVAAVGVVTAEDTNATPETFSLAGVTASVSATTVLFYPGAARTPTEAGFFAAITPDTSIAVVFGKRGSAAGTIDATNARVLNPGVRWGGPR